MVVACATDAGGKTPRAQDRTPRAPAATHTRAALERAACARGAATRGGLCLDRTSRTSPPKLCVGMLPRACGPAFQRHRGANPPTCLARYREKGATPVCLAGVRTLARHRAGRSPRIVVSYDRASTTAAAAARSSRRSVALGCAIAPHELGGGSAGRGRPDVRSRTNVCCARTCVAQMLPRPVCAPPLRFQRT